MYCRPSSKSRYQRRHRRLQWLCKQSRFRIRSDGRASIIFLVISASDGGQGSLRARDERDEDGEEGGGAEHVGEGACGRCVRKVLRVRSCDGRSGGPPRRSKKRVCVQHGRRQFSQNGNTWETPILSEVSRPIRNPESTSSAIKTLASASQRGLTSALRSLFAPWLTNGFRNQISEPDSRVSLSST